MKIFLSITLFLFLSTSVTAQYLEVRRSATIKENPVKNAVVIETVKKGDYLALLDDGHQQNAYYKVKGKVSGRAGWIYRTLVRRYEGSIPEETSFSSMLKFDPVPEDYYSGTDNIEGNQLKSLLHSIIKEHKEFSYGEVWDILKETDIDTLDTTKVVGLYSGFSMDKKIEYDGGKGWTREHVWAKSYGNFGTTPGAGTDLHHLRAEDVSTNSARNNRSFDESDVQYFDSKGKYNGYTSSYTSSTSWTWEPRDEVKGDVARMLFYMDVRYEGDDDDGPDLKIVDSINNKNSKAPMHGKLSTLLKWHQDDPVSNYERYRNDIIYKKYQHNRNPFIDHPEFVKRIWNSD